MTKKLHFTKQDDLISAKILTVEKDSNRNKIVFFKTIEIKDINPSELTMIIEKSVAFGQKKTVVEIPLIDHLHLIDYKSGFAILDATGAEEFYDGTDYFLVRVGFRAVNPEAKIDIEVFYTMIETNNYFETAQKAIQKHGKIYEEQFLK